MCVDDGRLHVGVAYSLPTFGYFRFSALAGCPARPTQEVGVNTGSWGQILLCAFVVFLGLLARTEQDVTPIHRSSRSKVRMTAP